MKERLVTIPQGTLRGIDFGKYCQFMNVPYAEDCGRFRTAGNAPCWNGIREATAPGPVFPQTSGRLSFVMGNTEEEKYQSESAFAVNIWRPSGEGKYPVLFWMHGGAFMTGGGAIPWYSGASLAEKGGTVAHESTPFAAPEDSETEEKYLSRVELNTRAAFVNDTELLLRYLGNAGHSVYRYIFAFESAMPHVHACHCFDVPFLFRNFPQWKNAPFLQNMDSAQAAAVSAAYSDAFVRFMKTGNPGDDWKPYDGTQATVKTFS